MAIFGTIKGLDLFSGIGGLTVALAPWVRPVAYCEIDRYAQGILLSKMGTGRLPIAPIWDDVRTLHRGIIAGHTKGSHDDGESIDIITGGFPCQDISIAGLGKGLAGERSGLFYEISRLTGELRPHFVFLENVPAITTRGGLEVVGAFAEMGYDCRWCVISAASIGAPHKRDRWFFLANAQIVESQLSRPTELASTQHQKNVADPNGSGLQTERPEQQATGSQQRCFIADASSEGLPQRQGKEREWTHSTITGSDWWATEPDVGRVAHGIPNRMDRIRGLGNAVVPLQARTAFKLLMGIEQDRKEIRTI